MATSLGACVPKMEPPRARWNLRTQGRAYRPMGPWALGPMGPTGLYMFRRFSLLLLFNLVFLDQAPREAI